MLKRRLRHHFGDGDASASPPGQEQLYTTSARGSRRCSSLGSVPDIAACSALLTRLHPLYEC